MKNAVVINIADARRQLDAAAAGEAIAGFLSVLAPLWAARGVTVEQGVAATVANIEAEKDKPKLRLVKEARR